jgi:AcrR family transcriptional regulator
MTPGTSGRSATRKRAVTRRDVLDVSLELFAQHGYRKTGLEHVAERLGVTRQALYYHFRSKDEILAALFDEMMTKLESAVADAALSDENPTFLALLRAHTDATISNPELVALLLHERPEIAELTQLKAGKRRRDYSMRFIESYEQGQQAGLFRDDIEPWTAVNTLLAAVNGISWWYHGESGSRTDASKRGREAIADSVFELLVDGFVLKTAEPMINASS